MKNNSCVIKISHFRFRVPINNLLLFLILIFEGFAMNFETFLNAFNPIADEEMCASLTPSFCPEIIDLLQYKQLTTQKTLSRLIPSIQEYGFDEHVHGLC